ncbi:MAG: corrinoid protein-associated methyltransferase CpaM [Nitrospiria bacterium]
MSTYILMRILESAPERYDKGISLLTLGRLNEVYNRLASHIKKGQKVLDIGCGTGAMTLRAAQKGAAVKGIDINSQMLEMAQKRAREKNLTQNIELCEMGIAELCNEESQSYDIVMSTLCFSELSENEVTYTLKEVNRVLRPGGLLLIADEVRSNHAAKRILNWLLKAPLVIMTYLITQTTTHAIDNLPEKIKKAGLRVMSIKLNKIGNFIEVVANKPI